MRFIRIAVAAVAAVLIASGGVRADQTFRGVFSGLQEVPPNASPATGFGTFVLNDAETMLTFNITYSGLIGGPIVGAHFHNAPFGVVGGIVRHVASSGAGSPDGSFVGVWSATDPALSTTDPNRGPLTPFLVSELKAGRIYFNIHTSDQALPNFPGGEIRAQVVVPEPGTLALTVGAALPLLGLLRRRRR